MAPGPIFSPDNMLFPFLISKGFLDYETLKGVVQNTAGVEYPPLLPSIMGRIPGRACYVLSAFLWQMKVNQICVFQDYTLVSQS